MTRGLAPSRAPRPRRLYGRSGLGAQVSLSDLFVSALNVDRPSIPRSDSTVRGSSRLCRTSSCAALGHIVLPDLPIGNLSPSVATPVLAFFNEMTIGRVATAKLVSIDPVGAEPWFFCLPANPNFFLNPSNHLPLTRASTYQTRGNPGNAGPTARCKSLIEKVQT
jgi:hypothetical protein